MQPGGIDSLVSIPGLLKSLQIQALISNTIINLPRDFVRVVMIKIRQACTRRPLDLRLKIQH
jgi:hypothetical protein